MFLNIFVFAWFLFLLEFSFYFCFVSIVGIHGGVQRDRFQVQEESDSWRQHHPDQSENSLRWFTRMYSMFCIASSSQSSRLSSKTSVLSFSNVSGIQYEASEEHERRKQDRSQLCQQPQRSSRQVSLIRINHCIILVIRTGVDNQRSKSVIALNPPKVDIYRSRSDSNLSFDQIVFMEEKDFESDSEDEVFDNETDSMGSVTPSSTDRRTQNDGPLSAFNPFSLKPPMPSPRRSKKPKIKKKDFDHDSEDEVFDNETDSMGSVSPSSTDRKTQNDDRQSAINPFSLKPPMPLPRRSRKPKIKIRFNQDAFQLLCCFMIDFILL